MYAIYCYPKLPGIPCIKLTEENKHLAYAIKKAFQKNGYASSVVVIGKPHPASKKARRIED